MPPVQKEQLHRRRRRQPAGQHHAGRGGEAVQVPAAAAAAVGGRWLQSGGARRERGPGSRELERRASLVRAAPAPEPAALLQGLQTGGLRPVRVRAPPRRLSLRQPGRHDLPGGKA